MKELRVETHCVGTHQIGAPCLCEERPKGRSLNWYPVWTGSPFALPCQSIPVWGATKGALFVKLRSFQQLSLKGIERENKEKYSQSKNAKTENLTRRLLQREKNYGTNWYSKYCDIAF